MAGKGTYGAYANAREVGDEFVDNLKHAERMGFRYRYEDERRKAREMARKKEIAKNLGVDLDDLHIDQSGIKDVDLPVYDYVTRTSKKLTELAKKMAEDENDYESQILYQKYQSSAKKLRSFVEKFQASQLDFKKGINEQKYSPYNNRNMPERLSKAFLRGDYKLLNDKNGDLQVIVDADRDGKPDQYADYNGDGKAETDIMALNVAEFLGGNKAYQPKLRYFEHKEQDKLFQRYGLLEKKEDEEGYMEIEYKGFDPEKEAAMRQDVEALLGNHENMTEQATSILADDLGIDPESLNKDQFEAFKKQFGDDIINLSGTTVSEKYNWRRKIAEDQNARGWNADRRAQTRLDRQNKDEPTDNNYFRTAKDPVSGEPLQLSLDGETEATTYTLPDGQKTTIDGVPVTSVEMYGNGDLGFVVTDSQIEEQNGENVEVRKRRVVTDKAALNEAVRKLPHPIEDRNYYDLDEFKEILSVSDELEDLEQQFGKTN